MAGSQTPMPPARPAAWATLLKLVGVLVVAGVLGAGIFLPLVGGVGLAAKRQADKFLDTSCTLHETAPPQRTDLYASDGKTLIATIFKQDRQPVTLSQVPSYLVQALVATEDRRFYSHHGVDIRGLIRSAINTSNGDTQGGSTLTMQYVKQLQYYQAGDNKKKQQEAIAVNLNRKIEDAKCALYIENTLHESKATILKNYLNIAFFGENAYGIQVAARTYFDKPASKLTLPESAMLVGLLRAPTQYDPFQYPEAAKARRNEVLQNLVAVGDLSQGAANKYKETPVSLATTAPPVVREGCDNARPAVTNVGFFCAYAVNWLKSHHVLNDTQLQTGGYKVVTTLDPQLQSSAEANLAKKIPASSAATAVLPVLNPTNGHVLAMAASKQYGSSDPRTQTELPIFTQAVSQGASTWKLFPLLAALSTGIPNGWKLETPPSGQPYEWQFCPANGKVYNGDAQETYDRNETLASATAKSSNTYFVGLADQLLGCNLQPILTMAQKLGMTTLNAPSGEQGRSIQQEILSESRATQLVLGDIPTSPLELASAYGAVANGGRYIDPSPILSISDRHGRPVDVPKSAGRQVLAPQVAARAVKILTSDTKYPGTSATPFQSWYSVNSSPVAGKTGTAVASNRNGRATDRNSAIWFVGMTPSLVGVSAIFDVDQPSYALRGLPGVSAGAAYGEYAAGVWLRALEPTLRGTTWNWQRPQDAAGVDVPVLTGMTLTQARKTLTAAGFKMADIDPAHITECPSKLTAGSVAYYAPQRAPRGSLITVCASSGIQQTIYVPPPPPPPVYVPPPPPPAPTPAPPTAGNGGHHVRGGGGNGGGGTGGGGGGTGGGGGGTGGGGGGGGTGGGGTGGGGGGTGGGGHGGGH